MKFDVDEKQKKCAKIPHEIFLLNLIGNHILMFIAALGIVKTIWQPLAMVPVISFCVLIYTFIRAAQSKKKDSWFVMCHWQSARRRSLWFSGVLLFALCMALLAWLGYSQLGLMKEASIALAGGLSVIPVMITALALILMESDSMYQAAQGNIADHIVAMYPEKNSL